MGSSNGVVGPKKGETELNREGEKKDGSGFMGASGKVRFYPTGDRRYQKCKGL